MVIVIEGVQYYTIKEVLEEVNISRQTLWRWRNDGSTPKGHRLRGSQIIFTANDLDLIREYANRVESLEKSNPGQLSLFD